MFESKIHYGFNYSYFNFNVLKKEKVPVKQKPHCAEIGAHFQQNLCLQLLKWEILGEHGLWQTLPGARWAE